MTDKKKNVVTLVIEVPEGVDLSIGCEITVQGHRVRCNAINWERDGLTYGSGLEQRLEAALEVIKSDASWAIDDYKEKLQDLRESEDLIEMPELEDFDNLD